MPVKKGPSGNRSIEAEVEVPGTPEEVWKAIASGPGISSWFVPGKVEERVDGDALASFGPGMDSVGKIKVWNPPNQYVVETEQQSGKVATEWVVEARAGGTCVVRVIHRWFSDTDDWDHQFEGHAEGWRAFFRNLRLYLTHFPGQPSSAIQRTGFSPESKSQAWSALTNLLGLNVPAVGQRVETSKEAPSFAGQVERVGIDEYPELLLRLDVPTSGIAHFFAMPMGGMVLLSVRFYLFGQQASAVTAEVEPQWQAWIMQHFPPTFGADMNC